MATLFFVILESVCDREKEEKSVFCQKKSFEKEYILFSFTLTQKFSVFHIEITIMSAYKFYRITA